MTHHSSEPVDVLPTAKVIYSQMLKTFQSEAFDVVDVPMTSNTKS